MCLDVEFNALADRLSEAEKEEFKIELLEVGDVEGRVFEGFEDSFFDLGGKVGGWQLKTGNVTGMSLCKSMPIDQIDHYDTVDVKTTKQLHIPSNSDKL